MGSEKLPVKRYCEECGRVIESKRAGVTLCRICESKLDEDFRSEPDRQRRKDRKSARALEESLFKDESKSRRSGSYKDRRSDEEFLHRETYE